jgi:hypothetical protein
MDALAALFLDVLKLCKKAGLGKVGVVALDGTKVKANASLEANLAAAGIKGTLGVLLADAGYWSEQNMLEAEVGDPELLIATLKDWKQREAARKLPPPRGRMPKNMNVRDWMERKLLTLRGRAFYKLRGALIEPIFGQTKDVRDCDTFMMRGHGMADGEWSLICATHNMLKLWRKGATA